MEIFEALLLGIIQGLTEFLPVSSSGHLELGSALLGIEGEGNLLFALVVHGATVLSTLVVFRKDILEIILGLFKFQWNEETQYAFKIAVSMIPVGIVGVLFEEKIESFFGGNLMFVGSMLLITACLLSFTYYSKSKEREVTFVDAIIIGLAQACAVMPGISRSGSTIATALILGVNKAKAARFSFLMVLLPILGANLLKIIGGDWGQTEGMTATPLVVGFVAAFLSGWVACTAMINIVKRGKLIYFAIYCAIVGLIAIFAG